MLIKSEDIINKIENEFLNVYAPYTKFTKTKYYDYCLKTIRNEKLMYTIIFNNDQLGIAPVKTFLLAYPEFNEEDFTNDEDKKGLGALFGFVFKNIFKYNSQKKNLVNYKNVKTATRYLDPVETIEVVREIV